MAERAQQIWFISEAGGGHSRAFKETPATLAAPLKRTASACILSTAEPQLLFFMKDLFEFWVHIICS